MVIGAGFAGLSAVRHLRDQPVEVTVVDHHNFHTFQPLLYQVATAGLDPADVAYPVRTIFGRDHNVVFRHGRAASVDLEARHVTLTDEAVLDYDHLVVATGARPEDFDDGAPTFVVVGGGATGVEMSGALVELLDVAVRRDRLRIDRERSRVILLEAGSRLLPGFKEEASRYAEQTLCSRGVDVRLETPVAEVTADAVRLEKGEWIKAAAVIWAGGVTVDGTLAATLPAAHGRGGRVTLEPDLSVAGHPEAFVVGDAGAVPWGPARPEACPQVAQVAMQSGKHAALQIARQIAGRAPTPFEYHDKGLMATIGRHAAVAQLRRGPVWRGTIGWLAWLGLHLVYLVGFRNRVVVLINWWWRYLDWPSGPRLIVADVEADL
jgi:NADH:ubiquinone reductase (H+-translocating)